MAQLIGPHTEADLPRVLDTTAFFDARGPEVQAIHATVQNMCKLDKELAGGGRKVNPEGRQRRTTSHARRRTLRRPNLKLQQPSRTSDAAASVAVATSTRGFRADQAALPDVHAARNSAALHGDADPSNQLADRAAAIVPGLAPGSSDVQVCETAYEELPYVRPTSRPMRRRPGRLQAAAVASCAASPTTLPAVTSGHSTPLRKLESHRWHAKRMEMRPRWEHLLPEGQRGRGHNERHVLRALHRAAVVHDSSYLLPLQLQGTAASLTAVLNAVTGAESAAAVMAGGTQGAAVREVEVMVHSPHSWPHRPITPARAMLLPAAADATTTTEQGSPLSEQLLRDFWLWVHPAARGEAVEALHAAVAGGPVRITCMAAHLRRLELRGPAAAAALEPLLPPHLRRAPLPAAAAAGSAVCAVVSDPRLQVDRSTTYYVPPALQSGSAHSTKTRARGVAEHQHSSYGSAEAGSKNVKTPAHSTTETAGDGMAASLTAPGADSPPAVEPEVVLTTYKARRRQWLRGGNQAVAWRLWQHPAAIAGPCSEAQVSEWRQVYRLSQVGLARPPPLPPAADAAVQARVPGASAGGPDSGHPALPTAAGCPAVLVKRRAFGAGGGAWSVVVPAGWVPLLWHYLIRAGALPIGQREWRWAASDQGATVFPWDFPDTSAGAAAAAHGATEAAAAAAKAVKAKQPASQAAWHRLPGASDSAGPQSGLLKGGWCVARSRAALQQLVPSAMCLVGSTRTPSPAVRQSPSMGFKASAGCADDAPVPMVVDAPDEAALDTVKVPSDVIGSTGRCLVRVRLRMCGRGSAVPGAAVHLTNKVHPASNPKSSTDITPVALAQQQARQHSNVYAQTMVHASDEAEAKGAQPIGFVTAGLPRGACKGAGASALCCAATLAWAQEQAEEATDGSGAHQPISVAVAHPTTGRLLPAEAFVCLTGRAGDDCIL